MKINQIVITENTQLDEFGMKDIQKAASKVQKGAQKFQKNVAQTGDAVAGAANAVGGAGAELAKQTIARPVGAAYNAVKGGLGKAADVAASTYGDVKQGVQNVGKAAQTVATDVGTAAGKTLGGAARAVGAIPGAVAGVGGAMGHGYDSAKSTVSGDPIPAKDQPAAQAAPAAGAQAAAAPAASQSQAGGAQGAEAGAGDNPKIAALQKQIAQKQKQIAQKQKELTQLQGELRMAQQATGGAEEPQSTAGDTARAAGNKAAAGIDALSNAWNKGVGMGTAGSSLMHQADAGMQTVKDKQGKEHKYKQVGDKWVDMTTNQEVEPATSAMLSQQKQAQPTTGAQAEPAAKPTKDVQARMANQVGQTQGGVPSQDTAPQPAAAPAAQGQEFKDSTGGKFNMDTGKPFASQAEADAQSARMEKDPAYMAARKQEQGQAPAAQQPAAQAAPAKPNFAQQAGASYGQTTMNAPAGIPQVGGPQPTTGAQAVPQAQPAAQAAPAQQAALDPRDLNKDGTVDATEKSIARNKAKQPQTASIDFSAALARNLKIKL